MNWRLGFVVTAAACAVLPLVVPQHSLTILVEALILGLFAMSLDLLVGYCRLYSFGHAAAYGLGAYSYALILTYVPLPLPVGILLAVAVTVLIAIPIAWICTRSTGVSFAMLTLAFAQLGYAMLFRFRDVTGGSDGLVGIPAPSRSPRHRLVSEQARLLLPRARLPARLLSAVPRHRALAVRRGARGHSRERAQDHCARLQHARVQDHDGRARLRVRRAGRRALRRRSPASRHPNCSSG